MNIFYFWNLGTVKPVYNGHPWDLKKAAVWQRCLIKLRFRLVVGDSNWPLLTGGRCSQVVVKSGLTVLCNCQLLNLINLNLLDLHLNWNINTYLNGISPRGRQTPPEVRVQTAEEAEEERRHPGLHPVRVRSSPAHRNSQRQNEVRFLFVLKEDFHFIEWLYHYN